MIALFSQRELCFYLSKRRRNTHKPRGRQRKKQTSDRAKQRARNGKRNNKGHFEKKVEEPDTLDTTELEGNIQ